MESSLDQISQNRASLKPVSYNIIGAGERKLPNESMMEEMKQFPWIFSHEQIKSEKLFINTDDNILHYR